MESRDYYAHGFVYFLLSKRGGKLVKSCQKSRSKRKIVMYSEFIN